jgi:hypothetical protein
VDKPVRSWPTARFSDESLAILSLNSV